MRRGLLASSLPCCSDDERKEKGEVSVTWPCRHRKGHVDPPGRTPTAWRAVPGAPTPGLETSDQTMNKPRMGREEAVRKTVEVLSRGGAVVRGALGVGGVEEQRCGEEEEVGDLGDEE
ncbi:hypothetical protein BHE74_00032106 [Ensete ventricosum]|nr:hypothetical protein BHE74_00032106 [Ensete ventricosum]